MRQSRAAAAFEVEIEHMSIYDRDYMGRRCPYGGATMTVTNKLLVANIVAFFIMGASDKLGSLCIMQPAAVLGGEVWRLFTSTYMHASMGHIFFNMLALYFFGPVVERVWGKWKFFAVYTVCGLAGNVVLMLSSQVGYISPDVLGLGASGSVLGVIGAATVLFPNATILLFFVIPMSLKMATLLFAGIYIVNIVCMGANYGGDVSHLVGLGIGAVVAVLGDRDR